MGPTLFGLPLLNWEISQELGVGRKEFEMNKIDHAADTLPRRSRGVSRQDMIDSEIALKRLEEIAASPKSVLRGAALKRRMKRWMS